MCFKIDKLRCKERLIADKDIICYKFLTKSFNGLTAPYYYFEYEMDKEYSIPDRFKLKGKGGNNEIHVGFHSNIRKGDVDANFSKVYLIGKRVPVECIIPKGSYYWKNRTEYVSNKLIIKKILYEKDKRDKR